MVTNKRLIISESHDNLNRCTPYWGDLIHMTRTLLAPVDICHMLFAGSLRTWEPLTLTQQSWTDSLLPKKSALDSTS
jgi:hypothetical protein